jgi:hypothetical protein
MTDTPNQEELDDRPPILGSWKNLYILVLVVHAIIIVLFYLITRAYS